MQQMYTYEPNHFRFILSFISFFHFLLFGPFLKTFNERRDHINSTVLASRNGEAAQRYRLSYYTHAYIGKQSLEARNATYTRTKIHIKSFGILTGRRFRYAHGDHGVFF